MVRWFVDSLVRWFVGSFVRSLVRSLALPSYSGSGWFSNH